MNLDKLLAKLFGVTSSEFKLTPQEKKILSKEESIPDKTPLVDLDQLFETEEHDIYEELLGTLLYEARKVSGLEDDRLFETYLRDLESFNFLVKQPKSEKKEFAIYLLQRTEEQLLKKDKDKNKRPLPSTFVITIANRLLKTTFAFTEKELMFLLNFWKHDFSYPLSLKVLINQVTQFSNTQPISNDFNTFLHSFLQCKNIKENDFLSYITSVSAIERVLMNNSGFYFEDGTPLFLLLPDTFGQWANQTITTLVDSGAEGIVRLLKILSQESQIKTPTDIAEILQNIDFEINKKELQHSITIFIEEAHKYKPKIKKLYNRQGGYGLQTYNDYAPMYDENITTLNGMVLLAGHYKINACMIPLQKLTERCYVHRGPNMLGKKAKILGNSCIHVLAHCFGEKGHARLHELYEFSKYKSIKTRIEKESAIVEQNTGTPLL